MYPSEGNASLILFTAQDGRTTLRCFPIGIPNTMFTPCFQLLIRDVAVLPIQCGVRVQNVIYGMLT